MRLFENKIIKNTGWLVGAQVVKTLLGFAVSLLTARYLGPSNYGTLNYAASITAFVAPIMYLGLNNTLVMEIINRPKEEGKVLGTSIVMSLISGVLCIMGVLSFVFVSAGNEPETIIVCFFYSIILLFQGTDLINCWFQAKLLSKYSSIASMAAYLFAVAYRVILLANGGSVIWFSLVGVLDYFIISAILLMSYKRVGVQKLEFSIKLAKELFQNSKFYIVSNLMIVMFAQTDRIMLKLMMNETEVGYYSVAFNCAGLAGMVFSAIIASMNPVILKNKSVDEKKYEESIIGLYSVIIYLSLAYSIIITLSAPFLINILYGEQFLSAIPVLQMIVWYGTSSYLGGGRDVWILAEKKQKHLLVLNFFGAVINIVLNVVLIPISGALGAAVATVVTQVFINIIFVGIYPPTRRNGYLMLKALNPKRIISVLR